LDVVSALKPCPGWLLLGAGWRWRGSKSRTLLLWLF